MHLLVEYLQTHCGPSLCGSGNKTSLSNHHHQHHLDSLQYQVDTSVLPLLLFDILSLSSKLMFSCAIHTVACLYAVGLHLLMIPRIMLSRCFDQLESCIIIQLQAYYIWVLENSYLPESLPTLIMRGSSLAVLGV